LWRGLSAALPLAPDDLGLVAASDAARCARDHAAPCTHGEADRKAGLNAVRRVTCGLVAAPRFQASLGDTRDIAP